MFGLVTLRNTLKKEGEEEEETVVGKGQIPTESKKTRIRNMGKNFHLTSENNSICLSEIRNVMIFISIDFYNISFKNSNHPKECKLCNPRHMC